MSMFSAFNINASGMTAQRYRMDIISENVANANTTRTADSLPRMPMAVGRIAQNTGQGVKVSGVYEDHKTPMNMVYDPAHPDADENGYVTGPNVNIITEMTNMIDASRAWEANSTAFNTSKAITLKGLELMNG